MFVFLDDERRPEDVMWMTLPRVHHDRWFIVRDYDEFRTLLDFHLCEIKFISFDHDLGSESLDGKKCAELLVKKCMDEGVVLPGYLVHSMNPVGKENIESYLDNFIRVSQQN